MARDVYIRYWHSHVGITSEQLAELERLAALYAAVIEPYERRASAIVAEAKVEVKRTGRLRPMPQELLEIEAKRVDIALDHRAMLRQALGATSFVAADNAFRAWLLKRSR